MTVCLQIDYFCVSGLESPLVLPRHTSSYEHCSWKKIEIPFLTANGVVPLHEACQTVFWSWLLITWRCYKCCIGVHDHAFQSLTMWQVTACPFKHSVYLGFSLCSHNLIHIKPYPSVSENRTTEISASRLLTHCHVDSLRRYCTSGFAILRILICAGLYQ